MDKTMLHSIQSQPVRTQNYRNVKTDNQNRHAFRAHLQSAIQSNNTKLTISKHANGRLHQRGIHINDDRWKKIEQKVNEAKKLGVKDSLVLLKDAALIISAKNNTVITAMDREEASSQIFTNINGTIVLES